MVQVLVIGSGAREHVFAQTLMKSPQVDGVYVAPGNPGMVTKNIKTIDIKVDDIDGLVSFALNNQIDLTLVGMENALMAGVVDAFRKENLLIFGPTKKAAMLEGSKSFTKKLLSKYDIPTAKYFVTDNLNSALEYIKVQNFPLVIKLDGLAFGKGVSICNTLIDANNLLFEIYYQNNKASVVIEEFLEGEEFSIFTFVGKNQTITTPIAQDHKRLLDDDLGPNTGGMGAYSPLPQISKEIIDQAVLKLVKPTLLAMKKENMEYEGILYTGVMLTKDGPKVIEYNVRFGDPEAQVVLPQLKSDFYQLLIDLLSEKKATALWQQEDVYLGVVLATPEYPNKATKDYDVIEHSDNSLIINYAGVKLVEQKLKSSNGRVQTIVGHAKTVFETQKVVYNYLKGLNISLQYRHDIGNKAIEK